LHTIHKIKSFAESDPSLIFFVGHDLFPKTGFHFRNHALTRSLACHIRRLHDGAKRSGHGQHFEYDSVRTRRAFSAPVVRGRPPRPDPRQPSLRRHSGRSNRNVLIEAENGCMPAHDGTAHAERLLATQACTTLSPDILKSATLYSSARMLFSPPSSKFTTNCTATRASPGQRGSGGLRP